MTITPDSETILLLGSSLALPAFSDLKPLTSREWNALAAKIDASPLECPAALLEADDWRELLILDDAEFNRIERLFDRRNQLANELERLESLGIWVITRADAEYPARLRGRLESSAPLVLFGAGSWERIGKQGIAIVGSRNVDDEGREAAEFAGRACALSHWIVYSGAARGVDEAAMQSCLDHRGAVVGVLPDSLEQAIRTPWMRQALSDQQLTLLTLGAADAPFSAGAAMARNKLIYALADCSLVIASEADTGGTWAGASQALAANFGPLFVRDGFNVPEGNKKLLKRGAISFPYPFPEAAEGLADWIKEHSTASKGLTLFG